MIEKFCSNCGKYDPAAECQFDNINTILNQEKMTECPMWTPIMNKSGLFESEVKRKFKRNMTYLEAIGK
jgi:hypothetical protein